MVSSWVDILKSSRKEDNFLFRPHGEKNTTTHKPTKSAVSVFCEVERKIRMVGMLSARAKILATSIGLWWGGDCFHLGAYQQVRNDK